MPNLKFARDLFLDKEELERFKRFLTVDGIYFNQTRGSERFGIIKNRWFDVNFNYFKVINLDDISTLFVNAGFAYDQQGNVLASNGKQIIIPQQNVWYWIKVQYAIRNTEIGTITIGGQQGNLMKGTGTKFTEVLRGQNNFAAKIKINDSSSYTNEFEVLDVIDDETAYLQGYFPNNEINKTYSVVGTFTPNVYPIVTQGQNDKYPFQYDDFEIDFVLENSTDLMPEYEPGAEFFIARVQSNTTLGILLEDRRRDFIHQTKSENYYSELPTNDNPLLAIESIGVISIRNNQYFVVNVGHGFRVLQELRELDKNRITVNSGFGGRYKASSAFATADFDNWRYYYEDGSYSRILSSTKQGSNIILMLDTINKNSVGKMICPNAEEVEFVFNFTDENGSVYRVDRKSFPSFTEVVQFVIRDDEVNLNNRRILTQYRNKTVFNLSALQNFNVNTYTLQNTGPITDYAAIINQASKINPDATLVWRGINIFCELLVVNGGNPVYYKVTAQNVGSPTTVYIPDNIAPVTSRDTTNEELLVQFYSDAGMTTPLTLTKNGLIIFVKTNKDIIITNYLPAPVTSQYTQENIIYYQVNVVAANNVVITGVEKSEYFYTHPTHDIGTRDETYRETLTYAVFPSNKIAIGNTGNRGYDDLEQYDTITNLTTGVSKPNLISDPDYIAPSTDLTNCNIEVPFIQVGYGYSLNMKALTLTGDTLGAKNPTLQSDTADGGWSYLIPAFNDDENVSISLRVATLDSGNISGAIVLRVTWRKSGDTVDTVSVLEIPNDVVYNVSLVFQNISSINISNF